MRHALLIPLCALFCLTTNTSGAQEREAQGLLALYEFSEGSGNLVRDRSGVGEPLDLTIQNPGSVQWKDGLEIREAAKIKSMSPATKLGRALKRSGEVTIEAWITPANNTQAGPARIVSVSKDASNRNVTLGQDKNQFDVRLRTTGTSDNGLPGTASAKKSVNTQLTHVVFTRDKQGETRIYLNGQLNAKGKASGDFSNWNEGYHLLLADEQGGGRLWQGTYHRLAIFHRSLNESEIKTIFSAGRQAPVQLQVKAEESQDVFVRKIAPLLSEHCLECHDASNREGGLDLSRKTFAFAGGDSGAAIVPGKALESSLFQSIEADDMPHDRPKLSAEGKQQIREWIDAGAPWSMDFVDPALFVHGAAKSQLWIQRLTREEYIATVKATLGVNIEPEAMQLLPGELRADGFANTAYNLNVDLKHIEAYSRLAATIASRIDGNQFASRFSKSRKFTDKDMGDVIEKMGKWILRGPLTEEEVIIFRGISTTVASSGGSFDEAIKTIVEAMLQSPRFLYRVENQLGDGSRWQVNAYELASRLSYVLWGSSPDEELFQLADKGELTSQKVFDAQVNRMIQDPRFVDRAEQFVSQWLNLRSLENLQPNAARFPNWQAELATDMQRETKAFFRRVALEQNRPLADLLIAQETFATPALAKHYRLKAEPEQQDQNGLARYDLTGDAARGGLLTQGAVLTIGGDDASTVTRGLFVLHDLLRGVVKDPPPCVDTTPIPTEPGLTQRMIATNRIKNEACGGCHSKFEPLAFGLGKFDGLGTYLEQDEHENPLQDDGEVLFPGQAEPVKFESSQQLMRILAKSERVQLSLTWKAVQFSLGRPLTVEDSATIDRIQTESQAAGGTYRSLMKAIVNSELIRTTNTAADETASDN